MREVPNMTRRRALEATLLAGGATAVGGLVLGGLPDLATSRPSAKQDGEILNFVLLLERIQAAFYREALARAGLTGDLKDFVTRVGAQEAAHVDHVEQVLGASARPARKLDFGDDTKTPASVSENALKLEDLGVAAYNAQAPNLTKDALADASRIVSVEARHAAWIRDVRGVNPAPEASEPTVAPARVAEILKGSGYVS